MEELGFLLLLDLEEEGLVEMRQDTAEGDCGSNEGVEFFVAADGQLQVARGDSLDLEVLGRVAGQFEDLGGEVFEHRGDVDCGLCADPHLVLHAAFEESLHTSHRELQTCSCRVRHLSGPVEPPFAFSAFTFSAGHCN
jgi:hypothetical protein